MATGFKDHFSDNSQNYEKYRPQYPDALFDYLASISSQLHTAWDCATGTGQSALSLTRHFSKVIATDASESQIANAIKHANIEYLVATAEKSQIPGNSIDLITVAQALHWFDIPAFTAEVERVLKQQGILAVWTYNLLQIQSDIDEVIFHLYQTILDDYWPDERKIVEGGYNDIHFPFKPLTSPSFHMSTQWNLSQLLGYLNTWSAVKRYQRANNDNPVEHIYNDLLSHWGEPETTFSVTWPLSTRIWLKDT